MQNKVKQALPSNSQQNGGKGITSGRESAAQQMTFSLSQT